MIELADLPGDVIVSILERLPLKDTVRSSVLSRQWRYRWVNISQIEFEDYGESDQGPKTHGDNLVAFCDTWIAMDSILKSHQGPIRSFKVTTRLVTRSKLDTLLFYLNKNQIKELVLDLRGEMVYPVHWILFSCQGITVLELKGCWLRLPPEFKGFRNLLQLHLAGSYISQDNLQSLISKSPLLKRLTLFNLSGFDRLLINSSSLEYLHICLGKLNDFSLVSTPLLATMYLELMQYGSWPRHQEIFNVSKILACANSIEKLELFYYTTMFLAKGSKLEKLPVLFQRLKVLRANVSFMNMEGISFLLSLLRSSPHLQELELQGCRYVPTWVAEEMVWRIDEDINCFNNLSSVKLNCFQCIEPEMEFIKFVLNHSPVLEKMEIVRIKPKYNRSREQVLIQLLQFQRASTRAKIVFTS